MEERINILFVQGSQVLVTNHLLNLLIQFGANHGSCFKKSFQSIFKFFRLCSNVLQLLLCSFSFLHPTHHLSIQLSQFLQIHGRWSVFSCILLQLFIRLLFLQIQLCDALVLCRKELEFAVQNIQLFSETCLLFLCFLQIRDGLGREAAFRSDGRTIGRRVLPRKGLETTLDVAAGGDHPSQSGHVRLKDLNGNSVLCYVIEERG